MSDTSKVKTNRGRKLGSTSFCTISGEVLAKFPSVVVSCKWAEAVGIVVPQKDGLNLKQTAMAPVTETETPLQVTIEE